MGRPRRHDRDELLDHARDLWAREGLGGLTIRSLSARSGVPNGVIYHAFGSRDGLVARVWNREAGAFLDLQRHAIAACADPVRAAVAAACAPADFARGHPDGSRVLLSVRATALLTDRLDPDVQARVAERKRELGVIITGLAERCWARHDPTALAAMTMCVVDLPSALLLARDRVTDPLARHALETAVRAIASTPLPG